MSVKEERLLIFFRYSLYITSEIVTARIINSLIKDCFFCYDFGYLHLEFLRLYFIANYQKNFCYLRYILKEFLQHLTHVANLQTNILIMARLSFATDTGFCQLCTSKADWFYFYLTQVTKIYDGQIVCWF